MKPEVAVAMGTFSTGYWWFVGIDEQHDSPVKDDQIEQIEQLKQKVGVDGQLQKACALTAMSGTDDKPTEQEDDNHQAYALQPLPFRWGHRFRPLSDVGGQIPQPDARPPQKAAYHHQSDDEANGAAMDEKQVNTQHSQTLFSTGGLGGSGAADREQPQ